MKDPLLEDIRRVRAARSLELTRDVHKAFEDSRKQLRSLGHDIVGLRDGQWQVVFKAPHETDDGSKSAHTPPPP